LTEKLWEVTKHGLKKDLQGRMADGVQRPDNRRYGDLGEMMFGKYTDEKYLSGKEAYELDQIPLNSVGNCNMLSNLILKNMKGLKELRILNCDLIEFPTYLPKSLEKLVISNNKI
jgi:hypothetical protein